MELRNENAEVIVRLRGDSAQNEEVVTMTKVNLTTFKESVVKNLNRHLSNPDDYLGIITVLTAFLSELRSAKYQLHRVHKKTTKFVFWQYLHQIFTKSKK